jgi:hypothetical protein
VGKFQVTMDMGKAAQIRLKRPEYPPVEGGAVACYLGSKKRKNGIKAVKVSVSVAEEDLKILKKRAKRLYDGNLSAVIHELAQKAKRQEAMERLIASFGGSSLTDADRLAIDAEWSGR